MKEWKHTCKVGTVVRVFIGPRHKDYQWVRCRRLADSNAPSGMEKWWLYVADMRVLHVRGSIIKLQEEIIDLAGSPPMAEVIQIDDTPPRKMRRKMSRVYLSDDEECEQKDAKEEEGMSGCFEAREAVDATRGLKTAYTARVVVMMEDTLAHTMQMWPAPEALLKKAEATAALTHSPRLLPAAAAVHLAVVVAAVVVAAVVAAAVPRVAQALACGKAAAAVHLAVVIAAAAVPWLARAPACGKAAAAVHLAVVVAAAAAAAVVPWVAQALACGKAAAAVHLAVVVGAAAVPWL
eukprot:gene22105-26637_t